LFQAWVALAAVIQGAMEVAVGAVAKASESADGRFRVDRKGTGRNCPKFRAILHSQTPGPGLTLPQQCNLRSFSPAPLLGDSNHRFPCGTHLPALLWSGAIHWPPNCGTAFVGKREQGRIWVGGGASQFFRRQLSGICHGFTQPLTNTLHVKSGHPANSAATNTAKTPPPPPRLSVEAGVDRDCGASSAQWMGETGDHLLQDERLGQKGYPPEPPATGFNFSFRDGNAKNICQAPFKLHCHPENWAQSAPEPSPRCSTMQYTFPRNLSLVCPFESEGEKLQTINNIRHLKHFC
jgi:hypothetical protein